MAPCIRVGNYIVKKKIGEGAFAEVRLAVHETTGEEFAVKVLDRDAFPEAHFERDVRREIRIMQYLRHPNIVNINAVLVTAKKMYIVMELVRGGELYDEIVSKRRVDERTSRFYFQQIVDAMVYCHRRGVVHRDLKPENLLLDGNGNVKITDFGMSWMKDNINPELNAKQLLQTQCGTPKYMAPEVIIRPPNGYDGEKLDAWECGMVLYALLAGYLPFSGEDDNSVFQSILNGKLRFPSHFSSGVKDLLSKLLHKDPEKRTSLSEVRSHSWFRVDYHGDAVKEREKALKHARPGPIGLSSTGSEASKHRQRASRVNEDGGTVAELTETTRQSLNLKPQRKLSINVDTSFKESTKAPRSRSRSRAHAQMRGVSQTRPRPKLRLSQKLEEGSLVIKSPRGDSGGVKVEPKPKSSFKIPISHGGPPEDAETEFQETVLDKPIVSSPLNSDRIRVESEGGFSRRGKAPPLSMKMSKLASSVGDDEDTPLSLRDRLKSPFGAMLRTIRSGILPDTNVDEEKQKTSWFSPETSPVSAAGSASAVTSPVLLKKNSLAQPVRHSNEKLIALDSEDLTSRDDAPTSSSAFRRFAAILQKR